MPSLIVCPSEGAELAVVRAFSTGAQESAVPVEVIDLRSEPAARLAAVTERLADWSRGPTQDPQPADAAHFLQASTRSETNGMKDQPIYSVPGSSSMNSSGGSSWPERGPHGLFNSYDRPLYRAALDTTPSSWRARK